MMDLLDFWRQSRPELLAGYKLSLLVTGASLLLGIPLGLVLALSPQARTRWLKPPSLSLVEIGRGASILVPLRFVYFGLAVIAQTAAAQDCKPEHTFPTITPGALTIAVYNYPPLRPSGMAARSAASTPTSST